MARRRSSYRRPTRSARQSNAASAALIGGLIALCAALIVTLVKLLLVGGRWYIGHWQRADHRGRVVLAGGLIGTLLVLWEVSSLSSTPTGSASFAVVPSPRPALASVNEVDAEAPTATATATPTIAPSSTALPPTPTVAPPTGEIVKGGNLRSAPRVAPETVIGQLCPRDHVEYLSQQIANGDVWYQVRVIGRQANCTPKQVAIGTEGWASALLLSRPSYAIEEYARAAQLTLPTPIVQPTATPRPTVTPKPAAPAAPVQPASSGVRVGAICSDGSRSYATGRGACSHHGGVARWLYQ